MARRLKPKQYHAVRMIAEGQTDHVITDTLKLRRNTLKRWRRVPEFYDAVRHYVEDIQLAAQYRLDMMEFTAIDALHTKIFWRDGDAPWLKQVMDTWNQCRNLRGNSAPNHPARHQTDPAGTNPPHAGPSGAAKSDTAP